MKAILKINADVAAGCTITEAAMQCVEIAKREECIVEFDFNGIRFSLCGIEYWKDVVTAYTAEVERRSKEIVIPGRS